MRRLPRVQMGLIYELRFVAVEAGDTQVLLLRYLPVTVACTPCCLRQLQHHPPSSTATHTPLAPLNKILLLLDS